MKKLLTLFSLTAFAAGQHYISFAQILTSNGATLYVNGGTVFCNGGIEVNNSSTFTNNGLVVTTNNSTLPKKGNFEILSNAIVSGNGGYNVEQDWVNDATFNGDNGEVVLYGNLEQFITSNNGTATHFNNLSLTGSGVGVNSRKTLVNVNASTSANGFLVLNDRELHTATNTFIVQNEAPTAISYSTVFNAEGFVSSLANGSLIRNTNQSSLYVFPVGSRDGVYRFRPVEITPVGSTSSSYSVRFNNYSADNNGFTLTQNDGSVEVANNLFYHSLKRVGGNVDANVGFYYLPTDDGNWESIGHWYSTQWKDMTEATATTNVNFTVLSKANWSFPTTNDAYVLIKPASPFSIPNVFTPNQDGVNDVYFITSVNLKEYEFFIVNRWGEVVFKSNNPSEGWDGTVGGKKCSDGVYFYTLKAKQGETELKKQGHITLTSN